MTRQRRVHLHVESLAASGRRFVDAWRRAERGEAVHEEHLSFESFEGLPATLSPKRIELLRLVARFDQIDGIGYRSFCRGGV